MSTLLCALCGCGEKTTSDSFDTDEGLRLCGCGEKTISDSFDTAGGLCLCGCGEKILFQRGFSGYEQRY